MDPDFWHARWREGRIGFHRSDVNPHLLAHLDHLGAPRTDAAVLVPLCGKSVDLPFLATRGWRVVGVEVSELACRALFEEHGIPFQVRQAGAYLRFDSLPLSLPQAGTLTLLCGDYFAVTPEDTGPIGAAWDRAALFAMPPDRRQRYVETLARLLPSGVPLLLVAVSYPAGQMQGPPFSVPEAEIRALTAEAFRIESSTTHAALEEYPRFRDAGLNELRETVYRARRG